jgi:hypothetical protein
MVPGKMVGTYDGVKAYRKEAIRIARDFNYGDKVIKQLKEAKTESEICRIMTIARRELL